MSSGVAAKVYRLAFLGVEPTLDDMLRAVDVALLATDERSVSGALPSP